MNFVKITCKACNAEGSMSLSDASYNGPYRCWKCRSLYMIKLEDDKLVSIEPLSEQELERIVPKKRPY